MWDYLGEHYRLLLGIAAAAIWVGAVCWYIVVSGHAQIWLDNWRNRRSRPHW